MTPQGTPHTLVPTILRCAKAEAQEERRQRGRRLGWAAGQRQRLPCHWLAGLRARPSCAALFGLHSKPCPLQGHQLARWELGACPEQEAIFPPCSFPGVPWFLVLWEVTLLGGGGGGSTRVRAIPTAPQAGAREERGKGDAMVTRTSTETERPFS